MHRNLSSPPPPIQSPNTQTPSRETTWGKAYAYNYTGACKHARFSSFFNPPFFFLFFFYRNLAEVPSQSRNYLSVTTRKKKRLEGCLIEIKPRRKIINDVADPRYAGTGSVHECGPKPTTGIRYVVIRRRDFRNMRIRVERRKRDTQ